MSEYIPVFYYEPDVKLKEGYGVIYQYYCNDKYYVGQTVNPWRRHRQHNYRAESYFERSIAKHNYRYIILCTVKYSDLDDAEKWYIKKYNSYVCGFNFTEGGGGSRGYKFSEEQILKRKKYFESEKGIEFKKQQSKRAKQMWDNPEFKQRISENNRQMWEDASYREYQTECSKKYWASEENKKQASERSREISSTQKWKDQKSHSMKQFYNSEKGKINKQNKKQQTKQMWEDEARKQEICTKIKKYYASEEGKAYLKKESKIVYQFTLDEVYVQEYSSISEQSRSTEVPRRNISKCANHPQICHSAGGYIWRFKKI